MGFGWLFIGYFMATLMSINSFGFLFWLVGYAIVLIAARKLMAYHTDFRYLCWGSMLMLLVCTVSTASAVTTFLYDQMILDTRIFSECVDVVIGIVKMVCDLVFHMSLFLPIRAIAKETEVEKISIATVRNAIFLIVFELLYIVTSLPIPALASFSASFRAVSVLGYVICLILNVILIGSCYARICDPSDLDMTPKPSRFAFVNRMRAESEERRAKKEAEFAARARERQERKREKKK